MDMVTDTQLILHQLSFRFIKNSRLAGSTKDKNTKSTQHTNRSITVLEPTCSMV